MAKRLIVHHKFRVGGYICETIIPIPPNGRIEAINCGWFPDVPVFAQLSLREQGQFRKAQRAAFKELQRKTGLGAELLSALDDDPEFGMVNPWPVPDDTPLAALVVSRGQVYRIADRRFRKRITGKYARCFVLMSYCADCGRPFAFEALAGVKYLDRRCPRCWAPRKKPGKTT